jgi:hypothetical protein
MLRPMPQYSEVLDAFSESKRLEIELYQLLVAIGRHGAPPDLERSLELAGQKRIAFDKFMSLFRQWQHGIARENTDLGTPPALKGAHTRRAVRGVGPHDPR